MENIKKLQSIAQYLGLSNIISELQAIELRASQENANIILPLVGEFSSGKTTLINALTDSKKLETATKPTTATIYEIHFGAENFSATVIDENGESHDIIDTANLKNEDLANAKVVTLFDTSKRVPSSTILVDTPGLSSPDPKHKETLVDFLPQADAILLVVDINQQITKSIKDFVETMKLSQKPIYIVLTKGDTKSNSDIEQAKKYISENININQKQISVVSAVNNSLDELYQLFDDIQKDKKNILKQVDNIRTKNIIKKLSEHIDELMKASSSDKELSEAIRNSQNELDKINRNIDKLIDSMSFEIEEQTRNSSRKFEDIVFSNLNTIIASKGDNIDNNAYATIQNTASLLTNEYKENIKAILRDHARKQKGTENEINLLSIENMDLSNIDISNLNYNLNLESIGHQYDGFIKTGMIVAAVGVATMGVASAAAGAVGGAKAGTAAAASASSVSSVANAGGAVIAGSKMLDIVDTASDIGSIYSNRKLFKKFEKATEIAQIASNQYDKINTANQSVGQKMGVNKGILDTVIGSCTEKLFSKPQRVKAIRDYIDSSLAPEYKLKLQEVSSLLINNIKNSLNEEASDLINQKSATLNQLRAEMKEKKSLFDKKMQELKEFRNILSTL